MEKRERSIAAPLPRTGVSLLLAALLCLSVPAAAQAAEADGGEGAASQTPVVVEDAPTADVDGAAEDSVDGNGAQEVPEPPAADGDDGEVAPDADRPAAEPEPTLPADVPTADAADDAGDADGTDGDADEPAPGLQPEGASFRYRYEDGTYAVSAWVTEGGERYYFGSDGLAVSGRQKIDGAWYWFGDDCRMQTGWVTWGNGTKSFFDWDGKALTGWRSFNGVKYYFDPSTAMSLRWSQKLGGSWYYFDSDSQMVKGWVTWKNGTKSFFDWDGKALTGWRSFNGVKYYFDPSTAMSLRWSQKLGGRWYYFNSSSQMVKGIVTWKDGTKSYYDAQGRETGGWVQSGGAWYYFDWSDGKAVRWHQKIGSHWYYFDSDYQMHTGWLKWSGVQKWSYFYESGRQAFGSQVIGGYRYTFDGNGETSTKPVVLPAGQLAMWSKAQNYYSNTNYIIMVNNSTHKVGVFRGSSYNWEPVWYWNCTTGASVSPTVRGTYTVGSRGMSFGSGYTCWYWTQFYGNYLFHSVLYQPGSMTRIQDGRLGISASHGCVRLDIECARWIYNNIPRGTRVVSY
ncbi:L,D-transpeptidase family protein [Adlercreutzia muris]|uniref:L,D-transpeptidase family protein n=2 Tax=Adlercreutzia muris TaxID=1796610 RepID=UPI0013656AC0|nr:L,D-transpeptidase family protein [Adlercreutzia muris]NCA31469.1 hypothetical protein [Adlercreutzia muris]